jgi:hypothetical protein
MSNTTELTRFDLEDNIQSCWSVVQDLQTVSQHRGGDTDIDAVARLYQIKFQALWDTFETLINNQSI